VGRNGIKLTTVGAVLSPTSWLQVRLNGLAPDVDFEFIGYGSHKTNNPWKTTTLGRPWSGTWEVLIKQTTQIANKLSERLILGSLLSGYFARDLLDPVKLYQELVIRGGDIPAHYDVLPQLGIHPWTDKPPICVALTLQSDQKLMGVVGDLSGP